MHGLPVEEQIQTASVGMGQIVVARKPAQLSAVLGSCVGVAIYHPRLGVGGLAHVVLPHSNGPSDNPAKFADTAVPALVQELQKQGVPSAGLVAKIAGGACMFQIRGPLQIGEANIQAVREALAQANIRLLAQHVGGTAGRRITLDCTDGSLRVEIAGRHVEIL
ncbi:MAG: chemotaxis protein CheD [Thermoguttaceae bacterium]|nr:chemotaxis protein CheD [Thermoguttaceae bacterium]MDW8038803.1 chemotaxis protein CheD [Thermoguttaceae bacterium]